MGYVTGYQFLVKKSLKPNRIFFVPKQAFEDLYDSEYYDLEDRLFKDDDENKDIEIEYYLHDEDDTENGEYKKDSDAEELAHVFWQLRGKKDNAEYWKN